ncbi:NAD-dependent epimerase/dehydratase family protein [Haladaptatus litoreus]|nr:NAD-dependent epimerase/dehydratase family protein [Haladaptatus litoreus]
MNVFIIGGTGLISSAIVDQLVDRDESVTVFTRGIHDTSLPTSVTHIRGDRHDTDALKTAVADTNPDVLIDMVCFSPETAQATVDAVASFVDQYVFYSTVDVYHRPPEHNPITENAARYPNISEYGRKKAAAEDVFMDASKQGLFETTVLRPWSTYGEGGNVLHTFGDDTYYLDRLRAGKPIIVHGDGTSLWGPCHRDDVARAFVNALGNETAFGEMYHVTSEEFITWNQYHCRVARAMDAPEPELVHIPTTVLRTVAPERTKMLRDHFQFSTTFDNSKARHDLDYEYTINFETGIARTIEWLDERDQIKNWNTEPFDDTLVEEWQAARNHMATDR